MPLLKPHLLYITKHMSIEVGFVCNPLSLFEPNTEDA